MTMFRRALGAGLLALLLGAGTARPVEVPRTAKEGIKAVTYPQLGEIVKSYRGQVLVVDFWNVG